MPRDARKGFWLIVFFDLPVVSKRDRRYAERFRKMLRRDGFEMMQFSVYIRYCRGAEMAEKHMRRVEKGVPPKGSVRVLKITDAQYNRMKTVLGPEVVLEETASHQMVLL